MQTKVPRLQLFVTLLTELMTVTTMNNDDDDDDDDDDGKYTASWLM